MLVIKQTYCSPLPQRAELFLLNLFENPPAEANETLDHMMNLAMCIINGFTWMQTPPHDGEQGTLIVYDNKTGEVTIREKPTEKPTTQEPANDIPDENTTDIT